MTAEITDMGVSIVTALAGASCGSSGHWPRRGWHSRRLARASADRRLYHGSGRSGSTLLERALGEIPGFVNVGELVICTGGPPRRTKALRVR
jgi:hypothetical protein